MSLEERKEAAGRKRVLVTGGAGFIGSNLCRRLLKDGCEVTCLDNLSTGFYRNIAELVKDPAFSFLPADVAEPISLEADEIYHLACPASPVHYQKDPVRTAKTNFQGALTVLELAVRCHARVLLASTSEVYGEPEVHPQPEGYRGNVNPDGVRACYDEGKRMAETLFFDYHRKRGADIRVVRIFNTYGPYMDPSDGRVISNLLTQALSGKNLTIYGDGTQTRCFCYIDDMVEALVRMMAKDGFTGPVNLGNPSEITMNELARVVRAQTGTAAGIVYRELPTDDPTRRKPDITLARKELGWTPSFSLEEGLKRTAAYYRALSETDRAEEKPGAEPDAVPGGGKLYHTGLLMGVFDLFHIGHLNLIRRAKAECEYLRIAVLSDALVEEYKHHPPVIPFHERMEILGALRDVDEVVSIDDVPSRLVEYNRRPFDCFFSGDDYLENDYWTWERQELKKLGADVVFFPYTKGQSSTQIRTGLDERPEILEEAEREKAGNR